MEDVVPAGEEFLRAGAEGGLAGAKGFQKGGGDDVEVFVQLGRVLAGQFTFFQNGFHQPQRIRQHGVGEIRGGVLQGKGFAGVVDERVDAALIFFVELQHLKVDCDRLLRSLENVALDMLGRAKKVVITKDDTTIVDGVGEKSAIEARISQIKKQIEDTTSDYDKEKLQERLAKLAGGVAVIRVGGSTEVEVKEKKDRVDDALNATRAAVEEGIVPGGGVALLRASLAIKATGANADQQAGINIVRRALQEPVRQIAQNAGAEGSVVVGTDDSVHETTPNTAAACGALRSIPSPVCLVSARRLCAGSASQAFQDRKLRWDACSLAGRSFRVDSIENSMRHIG